MLLPYLLDVVIYPYGYTFFQYLVFIDRQDLIKEAIKNYEITYIRDIVQNTPLKYALKR
jgi:hypothetical protein